VCIAGAVLQDKSYELLNFLSERIDSTPAAPSVAAAASSNAMDIDSDASPAANARAEWTRITAPLTAAFAASALPDPSDLLLLLQPLTDLPKGLTDSDLNDSKADASAVGTVVSPLIALHLHCIASLWLLCAQQLRCSPLTEGLRRLRCAGSLPRRWVCCCLLCADGRSVAFVGTAADSVRGSDSRQCCR
jgi:hypothetical protein